MPDEKGKEQPAWKVYQKLLEKHSPHSSNAVAFRNEHEHLYKMFAKLDERWHKAHPPTDAAEMYKKLLTKCGPDSDEAEFLKALLEEEHGSLFTSQIKRIEREWAARQKKTAAIIYKPTTGDGRLFLAPLSAAIT